MTKKKKEKNQLSQEDNSAEHAEDPNLQRLQLLADSSKDAKSVDGGPKPKRSNLKSFIINSLRRATYRWPPRGEALKWSRKEKGLYECAYCKEFFKNKEICLDHIIPVVDPKTGFTTWDDYIEKMFPEKEGFQMPRQLQGRSVRGCPCSRDGVADQRRQGCRSASRALDMDE